MGEQLNYGKSHQTKNKWINESDSSSSLPVISDSTLQVYPLAPTLTSGIILPTNIIGVGPDSQPGSEPESDQQYRERQLAMSYFLAGAAARVSSSTIISPLDCLKARLQFSQAAVGVRHYQGTLDAAKKMYRYEGILSFYRGLPARLAYVTPAAAISFACYEQFKRAYHTTEEKLVMASSHQQYRWIVPLVIGGMARVIGSTMRTPFDLARQRMQIQGAIKDRANEIDRPLSERRPGVYRHTGEAVIDLMKQGPKKMWTGLPATIMRDLPFAIIYFMAYETSRTFQVRHMSQKLSQPSASLVSLTPLSTPTNVTHKTTSLERRASGLSAPQYMASGAFAATCAVLATMPFDTIKLRLQTQVCLAEPRYDGIVDCARKIVREEGWRGFTKGVTPRLFYLVPSSACTFALYEIYKRRIHKWMGIEEEEEKIRMKRN